MKFMTFLLVFVPLVTHGGEREYVEQYCTGIPKTLEDGTRVDCLTSHYAIEYDFAYKYHEALGQALHYSRMTNKLPGIVLIVEKTDDCKYVERIRLTINHFWLPVRVQTVGVSC